MEACSRDRKKQLLEPQASVTVWKELPEGSWGNPNVRDTVSTFDIFPVVVYAAPLT